MPVKWHKSDYASYTSDRSISFIQSFDGNELCGGVSLMYNNERFFTRATVSSVIDSKKVCLFNQKQCKNNSNKMSRVEYESFWIMLEKKCKEKNDINFIRKIGRDFSKLAALEARYGGYLSG